MCADWRDPDWPPGKKVPVSIKRRKECHSQAAVSHGIQDAMGRGDCNQPQCGSDHLSALSNERSCHDTDRCCEQQRVRHATMPPKVAISYSEGKTDDINVWKHGAQNSNGPPSFAQAVGF